MGSSSEEPAAAGKHISVKVSRNGKGGQEILFKIDPDLPLRWLIIQYCERARLHYRTTRFIFNGAGVRETDTPKQLAMRDSSVIYAFPSCLYQGAQFAKIYIRMHKRKDTFTMVKCTVPILHQLKRRLVCCGVSEEPDSVCFVYNGVKLNQDHTADELNIEDGDVVDAFDFKETSCSLSVVRADFGVQVVSSSGDEFFISMNPNTTPLTQMMEAYCKFKSLNYGEVRFIHFGRMLQLSKTAEENGLKHGDIIDAFPLLIGGC